MLTNFLPLLIFTGSTGHTGQIAVEHQRVATRQLLTTTGESEGFALSNFYAVQKKSMDGHSYNGGVDCKSLEGLGR
jgi:hypothetical protein